MRFSRLIMADWSAANAPGPQRPHKDRCWVGRLDAGEAQPEIVYCRTRFAALAQIEAWTGQANGAPVLIGFDFPFGYPDGSGLPGGRALCDLMAGMIEDSESDRNNRFAVAAELNRRINPGGEGPFWGHPASHRYEGLRPTRPKPWPEHIPELRLAEQALKGTGIQTVWKLAYPASVGSQVLMGMNAIHRLLHRPAFSDARLWPFETGWGRSLDGVVIAEIWPNLFYPAWRTKPEVQVHAIRDAQQVAATLLGIAEADANGRIEQLLAEPTHVSSDDVDKIMGGEGWIVGA